MSTEGFDNEQLRTMTENIIRLLVCKCMVSLVMAKCLTLPEPKIRLTI